MNFRIVTVVILAMAALAPAAFAQVSINGSLRGHISDPDADSVAGISVKLTNTATAIARMTVSDDGGDYRFVRMTTDVRDFAALTRS